MLDLKSIDKNWSLFLDRDGVINDEILDKYVLNWEQFSFSKDILKSFPIIKEKFGPILIVTNQRGVSKGLMTEEDLINIHEKMLMEINEAGGRIDQIYYCTDIDDSCLRRKPNPGMAHEAQTDFPLINFSRSIMVGNKPGDMKFGRNAGMFTIFITSTNPDQPFPHPDIDLRFTSLYEFARAL
jgi:histidinol-phosphate phosphatase family protein